MYSIIARILLTVMFAVAFPSPETIALGQHRTHGIYAAQAGVKTKVAVYLAGRAAKRCLTSNKCRDTVGDAAVAASKAVLSSPTGKRALSSIAEKASQKLVSPNLGRKLDYLFGQATGRLHNIDRSQSMLRQLQRIGLPDRPDVRRYLADHFTKVVNDPSNIVDRLENGYVKRESLLMGPRGALKMDTIWDGARLITAMLKG